METEIDEMTLGMFIAQLQLIAKEFELSLNTPKGFKSAYNILIIQGAVLN